MTKAKLSVEERELLEARQLKPQSSSIALLRTAPLSALVASRA